MYGRNFDMHQERVENVYEAQHKEYIQCNLKRMLLHRKMELKVVLVITGT